MTMDKFKVPVSMLSPIIDAAQLGFEDTSELEPLTEIIGQEEMAQAVAAWSEGEEKPGGRVIISET